MIALTEMRSLWQAYIATHNAPVVWDGDVARGDAGTLHAPSINAIVKRINFYRSLCRLEPVVNDPAWNQACQECCLVLSGNPTWGISHSMPLNLRHYTRAAAVAAQRSCIDRGDEGPRAIADFVRDWGLSDYNRRVGHRRYLLHPRLRTVGVGAIPMGAKHPASCTVYVMTSRAGLDAAYSWPSAGYFPATIMPERWNYHHPGANMAACRVIVNNRLRSRGVEGPDVFWQMANAEIPFNAEGTYHVRIENIYIGTQPMTVEYDVIRTTP